mgnify:CR=1 FL=1
MFFQKKYIFHRTYALGLLHLEYELLTPKTRKVTSENMKKSGFFSFCPDLRTRIVKMHSRLWECIHHSCTMIPWTANKNFTRKLWITFWLVVRLCCALDMFQGAPARCPGTIPGVTLTLMADNGEFSHRDVSKKGVRTASARMWHHSIFTVIHWRHCTGFWMRDAPAWTTLPKRYHVSGWGSPIQIVVLHGMGMSQAAIQRKLKREAVCLS